MMSQDKLIDQFMDHVPQQALEENLSPDMIEAVQAEVAKLRAQLKDAYERLRVRKACRSLSVWSS